MKYPREAQVVRGYSGAVYKLLAVGKWSAIATLRNPDTGCRSYTFARDIEPLTSVARAMLAPINPLFLALALLLFCAPAHARPHLQGMPIPEPEPECCAKMERRLRQEIEALKATLVFMRAKCGAKCRPVAK